MNIIKFTSIFNGGPLVRRQVWSLRNAWLGVTAATLTPDAPADDDVGAGGDAEPPPDPPPQLVLR
ncbi:MAG TPA: hypothetical protein EYO94_07535 [Acidobacteria bacterium]|nr:hypothetical protein [Acidobacteriota bacterium]